MTRFESVRYLRQVKLMGMSFMTRKMTIHDGGSGEPTECVGLETTVQQYCQNVNLSLM